MTNSKRWRLLLLAAAVSLSVGCGGGGTAEQHSDEAINSQVQKLTYDPLALL